MTKTFSFLCLLFISLNAAKHQTPGAHKRIPCDNVKKWSFDLYIPKAYATKPKKKFPVFYICNSGAFPGFRGFQQWAEEREFLLIVINNSSNRVVETQGWEEIFKIQNEVLKSTAYLRAHHCLRFATGASGGAWASVHLTKNHPEKFAGVLLQVHSGNGTYAPKHIVATFLYGKHDKVHGSEYIIRAMNRYRKQGNHILGKELNMGHGWTPKKENIKMLNFMYDYQRFNHKNLTKADLKEAWDDFATTCAPLFKKEHSTERTVALLKLLENPKVLKEKIGRKILRYWGRAITKDLKALKKKPRTAYKLVVENTHYLKQLKGKTKKKYLKAAKPIISHSKNRKEVEALTRYEALHKRQLKVGDDQEKKDTLIRKYEAIIRNHPKALVIPQVKEAIELLKN